MVYYEKVHDDLGYGYIWPGVGGGWYYLWMLDMIKSRFKKPVPPGCIETTDDQSTQQLWKFESGGSEGDGYYKIRNLVSGGLLYNVWGALAVNQYSYDESTLNHQWIV